MSYNHKYKKGEYVQTQKEQIETVKDVLSFPFMDLPDRKIRKETCERFGVRVGLSPEDGKTICAVYFPSLNQKGKIVGFMRADLTKNKEDKGYWTAVGSVTISNKLFGQDVAESIQRKRNNLVITEGPWDMLSVAQAQVDSVANTKYKGMEPFVVSIPLGTKNAVEAVYHNKQFVLGYDALTIFFDDDFCTPGDTLKGIVKGHEARDAVAGALIDSDIDIYTIQTQDGFKDASDYVQADMSAELARLVQFERKPFTADKIISAKDIDFEEFISPRPEGILIKEFPKLNEKLHGFRTHEANLLLAPSSVGKCHAKNDKIRMHDMSTKCVQDIVVGDLVMGDDGTPRRVIETHSGVGELFNISSRKGTTNYTVNNLHTLSLKLNTSFPTRGWKKGDTVEMSVAEYMSLPKSIKEHNICGYKADLVNLGKQIFEEELVDEAYMLGLWLAEGTRNDSQYTFCKGDIEVIDAFYAFAKNNGFGTTLAPSSDRKGSIGPRLNNGFRQYLRSQGVFNNKHIPQRFKTANYHTRLQLLAGFIDGDGHKEHNCFELCLKDNELVPDIIDLARSVGLAVSLNDKFSKCPGFSGEIYKRIVISGNTDKIPNRVLRKKCAPRRLNKDALRSGIIVKSIGVGDYYGFEVDGNHLYCTEDFSVTHNSTVSAIFAGNFIDAGERVGAIYLEEQKNETLGRMVARNLHVNYLRFKDNPLSVASKEDIKAAYDNIVEDDKLFIVDHFGSLTLDALVEKIKYLHFVVGCRYIILDHLGLIMSKDKTADERKSLDYAMTELASFAAANDVCLIMVCHINRSLAEQFKPPKGEDAEKPYWVKVTKESARGSAALEQLSFAILGLEPEINPDRTRGRTRIVVLKNRIWSSLGEADVFTLDNETWDVVLSEDNSF